MPFKYSVCKSVNKCFPIPVHPFNLENEGKKTYAQWQFEKGEETVRFYLDKVTKEDIFKDKVVLDIGCGAGGKTLYYASLGAKKVYGLDIVERYLKESNDLANKKGLSNQFEFVLGNAANLQFEGNYFDSIIMNDAMEHVNEPLKVLNECHRVLKPSGKLYINFPPYFHPFGAHLSDAIGIPWVHLFFDEKTLIQVYKDLVKEFHDGKQRINFRISEDENDAEYFSYINRMTIKRFKKLLIHTDYSIFYYNEIPLRECFKSLSQLPVFKEGFVKMVVCILEKQQKLR
ncbi:MAG: class I SAM-dependent methyltransferase [Clostridia bacterium]